MHACETQLPILLGVHRKYWNWILVWVRAMLTLAHSPRGSGISAVRALNREVVSATSDGDIVYRTKVVAPRQQGLIAATGEPASFEQPMTGEQLMLEIDRGNLTKVRVLLASGVPADTSMDSGQKTALMLAAERGHVSVAKELILNGADPNGTSKLLGSRGPTEFCARRGCRSRVSAGSRPRTTVGCSPTPD